jgi:hypothetical protein
LSWLAACLTRSFTSALAYPRPLSAREAVAMDTPALLATSTIVTVRFSFPVWLVIFPVNVYTQDDIEQFIFDLAGRIRARKATI